MDSKKTMEKIIRHLADRRKEIATLPAEEALDRILTAPEPAALVHSFPEQDLHLLIQDIGLTEALPLIKLASNRQWEYFLDVEGWDRDRIDLNAITHWTHLLLSADPIRLARWAGNEKVEFFEYYLFKNIRVVIRDHDQDPSDFGNDFSTLDGVFYYQIIDDLTGLPTPDADPESEKDYQIAQPSNKARHRFITELLKRLADEDSVRYHQILIEAMHVIPAESEEEIFRKRNVRMAEKGFLPFDEAIGIYQPLMIEDVKNRLASRREYRPAVDLRQPVARFAARFGNERNPVIGALEVFDDDNLRSRTEMELVGLANRLIVADQKPIRDRTDLKDAVQKACGYIRIGLSGLSGAEGEDRLDSEKAAAMMTQYSLPNLFRLGFGYALQLKWRADRWYRQSWFRRQGLTLTFWGEAWMGALGGVLLKKPQYFDEANQDQRYREFTSMDDITATKDVLGRLIAMDELLNRINIDFEFQCPFNVFLTYKNLTLTFWARDILELSYEVAPIELARFQLFYQDHLFKPRGSQQTDGPAHIRLSAKQSFLEWLIRQSGLSEQDLLAKTGPTLDELFGAIEDELGRVKPENIDPRFVSLFLLK